MISFPRTLSKESYLVGRVICREDATEDRADKRAKILSSWPGSLGERGAGPELPCVAQTFS